MGVSKTESNKLRLLVVDDQSLFLDVMAEALRRRGALVATTTKPENAERIARQNGFDVACLDVRLADDHNGFQLARSLRRLRPDAPIVFLSVVADPDYFSRNALGRVPGCSYLLKSSVRDADQLFTVIKGAYAGRLTIDPAVIDPDGPNTLGLTRHQLELLRAAARGKTNSAIAAEFNISPSAVEAGFTRIAKALGIRAGRDNNLRVACVASYYGRALCG